MWTKKLAVLLILAFAVRIGLCAQRGDLGRSPPTGYREYVIVATRLLEQGTLTSPLIVNPSEDRPSALMPPVYAGLVACVYATLGVAIAVWLAVRWSAVAMRGRYALGFGAWLGLLALLNPALTTCYPLLVLWAIRRVVRPRLRRMARPIALATLGWLVVIAPWTVRNYARFDRLVYVRSGLMEELWLGVCPQAEHDPSAVFTGQFPLTNEAARDRVAEIGEQAYLGECERRAIAAIRLDPWRYARLSMRRALDFWAGTLFTHAPLGAGGWPRDLHRAALAVVLSAEVLIIPFALWVGRRSGLGKDLPWLLAISAVFSVTYVLTHVQVRYRVPIEPVIVVVLALSVRRWLGARRLVN